MKKKSGTSVIQQRLFDICDEMAVSRRAFSMNIGKSASYLTNLVDDITTEVLNIHRLTLCGLLLELEINS